MVVTTSDPEPDRVSIQAPETIRAGLTEIELRNRGDTLHDLQLFRVEGSHSAGDVASVLESADAASKPAWLHPAGGVGATAPGETAAAIVVLEPGTYYFADTQERDDPSGIKLTNAVKDGITRIDVEGDSHGSLPDTPAKIVASSRGFEVDGIVAGANRVTFQSDGTEMHQAVALPIARRGAFRASLETALERESDLGWVPVDIPHTRATAVLEGGLGQVTEMVFRPGRYALLCFVSKRAGGEPQWMNGTVAELDVSE